MNVLKIRNEMRSGKSIFDLPLRVTFYARVSTDKDEQLNSLENQVQYYTELIQSKPNWTYIPGYIDEGISGTSTKKRDSFLRMIADAKAGQFDFIITKEISRFSRSTLDSIQYTQELLEHDVGVLFQNDNINTLDSDSEFRLVVMAGVAQDEVRKLSERLKFGFRQAIKNGHVLGNDKLWGYRQDVRHVEAEIDSICAKKDRLLEMSIEGALSTLEFKQRNDAFNQQIHELERQMGLLKAEEEKSQISVEQLEKIKAALEAELSFQNGINSALVTTILDHIVVKKGSTKEKVRLDIYLKFGDPYGVVFDRENSSFCFSRPKSTIHKAQIRRI